MVLFNLSWELSKKFDKFWPQKKFFFRAKMGFYNSFINIYACLEPVLKNWLQNYQNQLKNLQKIQKWRIFWYETFYFWNWNLQFQHLLKNPLLLGRSSSRWIKSNFYINKVSIWRHFIILTFSGLHFLFSVNS